MNAAQGITSLTSRACRLAVSFWLLAFAYGTGALLAEDSAAAPEHAFFCISLDKAFAGPVSGRLLLFVAPSSVEGTSVDMDMMSPTSVYVAAKEVAHLAPGESVDIDVDDIAFPHPFSKAPAGSYRLQAVLDVH